jgi:hypothetical protein
MSRPQIGLSLDPANYEGVQREAKRQFRTLGSCINQAIAQWLDEQQVLAKRGDDRMKHGRVRRSRKAA